MDANLFVEMTMFASVYTAFSRLSIVPDPTDGDTPDRGVDDLEEDTGDDDDSAIERDLLNPNDAFDDPEEGDEEDEDWDQDLDDLREDDVDDDVDGEEEDDD